MFHLPKTDISYLSSTVSFVSLIGLLFIIASFFFPVSSEAASTKITATYSDWAPYAGKDLPGLGELPILLTQALEEYHTDKPKAEKYELDFIAMPKWKNAKDSVKIGQQDLSIGWTCSQKRRADFIFSRPIGASYSNVFHLKTTSIPEMWNRLGELKPYGTLGVTASYFYSDDFQEDKAAGLLNYEEASTDALNIKKLLAGRVEFILLNNKVGLFTLSKTLPPHKAKLITFHQKRLGNLYLHAITGKSNRVGRQFIHDLNPYLNLYPADIFEQVCPGQN